MSRLSLNLHGFPFLNGIVVKTSNSPPDLTGQRKIKNRFRNRNSYLRGRMLGMRMRG